MKKLLLALAGAALLLSACNKELSNEALKARLDQHDKDIAGLQDDIKKLQDEVSKINTNVAALQQLVDALNKNYYIKSVDPIVSDGETIGYTITFTNDKNPIVIYHGEDGADGKDGQNGADGKDGKDGQNGSDGKDGQTPVIGMKEVDGVLYWTINGEFLKDESNHLVPVTGPKGADGTNGTDGKDGITPQIRINSDTKMWEVSVDNGETWTAVGPSTGGSGDAVFSGVKETKSQVVFTLADGTKLAIDKYVDFTLVIDDTKAIDVVEGKTTSIPYTLSGVGSGDSRLDAVASGDWWAEVEAADKVSGVLKVTAGSEDKAKVILYAVDGKGRSDIRSLIFNGGTLTATAPVEDSPTDGGTVDVPIVTNVEYAVNIEEDAQYWLSYSITKAGDVRNEKLVLTVEKNTLPETRTALVEIQDPSGAVIQSFTVKQESGVYEYPVFEDNDFKNWVLYNSAAADYNENLKVDASEAAKITELTISKDYTSLKGIECFYNLKKITISSTAKLTSVDLSKNKKLQEVTISKSWGSSSVLANVNLSDLHALKTVQMGGMTTVETLTLGKASALAGLYVYNTSITALDVTACPELTELAAYGTKVTTLDLSKNTKLTSANVGISTLESLTLPENPILTTLNIDNALISSLDLSKLTELSSFSASATKMSTIDLSNSAKLLKFSVGMTGSGSSSTLKEVDLRKASALNSVSLYSSVLEKVYICKGVKTSSWNWTSYHINPDTGEYTYVNVVEIEDEGGDPVVDDLAAGIAEPFVKKVILGKFDANGDGIISSAEGEAVTELDFSECGLVDGDLVGLEVFPLKKLNLAKNAFTTIDILAFPALEWLNIDDNKLTEISIGTSYTALKQPLTLSAANNNISKFVGPSYYANVLSLDLSGNALTSFSMPYPKCIEYCDLSNNALASVSLSSASALKELYVNGNKLTSVSFSGFSKLEKVDASDNALTSYTIGSGQTKLEEILLKNNSITSLDLTSIAKNPSNYALKTIDVTGNEGFNLVIVGAGNTMPESVTIVGGGEYVVLNAANPTGYITNQYNYISSFAAGEKAEYGDITLNYSLATKGFKIEDGGTGSFVATSGKKVLTLFAIATSGTPQITISRSSGKTILTSETDSSPYGSSYKASGSNPLTPSTNESAAKDWTNFVVDGNGNKVTYHFSACGSSAGNTDAGETITFTVSGGTAVIFGINLSSYRVDEQ